MSKAIGIDLGSTLSEVALIENGKPVVIVNEEGGISTPSVIGLKDGERKVGSAAKRQMIVNPKETVNLIKRFMGATYDESADAIKHVQYNVLNKNGLPRIEIEGREYSPEELSSMIVAKMKKVAESYTGEEIKDAVITVPAFFSDSAKNATKEAGNLAGLNVLRIIAEPTAAILSSNIDKKKGGKYMVVDFGGSTLDNSVADIEDGVVEIKSSYGDVYCGGSDIDNAIAKYVVDEFMKKEGVDLSTDPAAMTRVLEAVEQAKIELSNSSVTEINMPYITVKDDKPIHLNMEINRATFERLISPIVKKVIDCGSEALRRANITANELDGILLIGGSCRIPMVQNELIKAFGDKLIKSSNFDLAVAEGAAIQANILTGGENEEDILLLDVTPISIGIETIGGVFTKLVESNTTIPYKKTEVFTTAADNQPSVEIRVLQGERPMASDNKLIGAFKLDGILPAMRGVPQIEVTFDIDANGILSVSAKDKATGKEQSVKIESKNKLTDEEIERIKKEAEEYAESDKKKKEEADIINNGDSLAFNTKKSVDELGDKITEDEKKLILEANAKLEEAVKNRNVEDIKKYSEETTKAFTEYYKRANPSQQQNQGDFGSQAMNADMFNQMFMNNNNQK